VYPQIPLPRSEAGPTGPERLRAEISSWARSQPMRDLVTRFGESFPAGDLGAVLRGLDEISERKWNFREGKWTRAEARSHNLHRHFDAGQIAQVTASSAALGLTSTSAPVWRNYDHLLILASYLDSCLERAARAAHLVSNGVSATEVTALASYRALEDYDHRAGADLGIDSIRHEADAMDIAIRRAFGVADTVIERDDRIRSYRTPAGLPVSVVVAVPIRADSTRANTGDTYQEWVSHFAPYRARILIVTTSYFVPFQHCDAVRMIGLPRECEIETIGVNPPVTAHEPAGYGVTTADYLMEIRSAIRSMRSLHASVDG
jgi:hypothetical protein